MCVYVSKLLYHFVEFVSCPQRLAANRVWGIPNSTDDKITNPNCPEEN